MVWNFISTFAVKFNYNNEATQRINFFGELFPKKLKTFFGNFLRQQKPEQVSNSKAIKMSYEYYGDASFGAETSHGWRVYPGGEKEEIDALAKENEEMKTRIAKLEEENADLKQMLDVGSKRSACKSIQLSCQEETIALLRKKIEDLNSMATTGFTVKGAFNYIAAHFAEKQIVLKDLEAQHGTGSAAKISRIIEKNPVYNELFYGFDAEGALEDLYEEHIPIAFRGMR
jgi:hypothetical protein